MAITASARRIAREVITDRRAEHRRGVQDAVLGLRHFAELAEDEAERRVLLRASGALGEVWLGQ